MNPNLSQQLLFSQIKSRVPMHLSFVDEVATLLNISNDSAYRRIRGEKPIGLDEMQLLCHKYHVSLDHLLQKGTNAFIFSGNLLDPLSFGLNQYLQFMVNSLETFKSLQNPHYYCCNKDIPPYHFMHFPELCAFKFHFWKRTVIGYPELARQQFTGVEADKEAIALSKKIIDLYTQIDSTEIWNEENINCSIRQIDFYKQSNLFADNAILLKLYSQLEEMVNHLELQAETGLKLLYNRPETPNSPKFDMYINEYLLGDNTVYVRSTGRQITFLNHTGLNFMSCQDDNFCDYIFSKLQNIIRKSTHIGVVGEKERRVFFNLLREKIRVKKNSVTS